MNKLAKKWAVVLMVTAWLYLTVQILYAQPNGNFNVVRLKNTNDTTAYSSQPVGTFLFRQADSTIYLKRSIYGNTWSTLGSGGGSGWSLANGGTLTGANTIIGTTSNTISFRFNALGTSQTNGAGLWLKNLTAATNGAQQISPSLVFEGQGFQNSLSNSVKIKHFVLPVQTSLVTDANFDYKFKYNIGGSDVQFASFEMGDFNTSEPSRGNLFIGLEAGQLKSLVSDADNNTIIGNFAGRALTTGTQNTILGSKAGRAITTGDHHVIIGQGAGYSWDTQDDNIAIGFHAAINHYGPGNTFIGTYSGQGSTVVASNTGQENTALGYGTMTSLSLTTALQNTAIGASSLANITTGGGNAMVGYRTGFNVSTGGGNVGIGKQSLQAVTTGNNNISLGNQSGLGITGDGNIAIGTISAYQNTGSYNTFIGYSSGQNTTSGNNSVAIGYVDMPNTTASNQLNIQNAIFGTGNSTQGLGVSPGNIGLYVTAPSARLHLPAGTASASTAPLKFTAGTVLSSAEAGAVEFATNSFKFSPSTTTSVQLQNTGVLIVNGSGKQGSITATSAGWDDSASISISNNNGTLTLYGNGTGAIIIQSPNAAQKLTITNGHFNFTGLPTSSAGLNSGDIYSNAGILTIVP